MLATLWDANTEGNFTSMAEPCGRRSRPFLLGKLWPIYCRDSCTFSSIDSRIVTITWLIPREEETEKGRKWPGPVVDSQNTVGTNKLGCQVEKAGWRVREAHLSVRHWHIRKAVESKARRQTRCWGGKRRRRLRMWARDVRLRYIVLIFYQNKPRKYDTGTCIFMTLLLKKYIFKAMCFLGKKNQMYVQAALKIAQILGLKPQGRMQLKSYRSHSPL